MQDLASFEGFVPRWYIPRVQFDFDNFDKPVDLNLMIFNPEKENYVDVGFDWPPIRLDYGEIMV